MQIMPFRGGGVVCMGGINGWKVAVECRGGFASKRFSSSPRVLVCAGMECGTTIICSGGAEFDCGM